MSDASEMPAPRSERARAPAGVGRAGRNRRRPALGAIGWQWWNTRGGGDRAARRGREAHAGERARTRARAATIAQEAQEAVRDAQARIGALEARLLESQGQQLALEALYQELSRSRDDWLLAEDRADARHRLAATAARRQRAGGAGRAAKCRRAARALRPAAIPAAAKSPGPRHRTAQDRADHRCPGDDAPHRPSHRRRRPAAAACRRSARSRTGAGAGGGRGLGTRVALDLGRAEKSGARAAPRRPRCVPARAGEPLFFCARI